MGMPIIPVMEARTGKAWEGEADPGRSLKLTSHPHSRISELQVQW